MSKYKEVAAIGFEPTIFGSKFIDTIANKQ
jgi:hypothetical protein